MFLLTISLFLHVGLLTCVLYEKKNFSEDSMVKSHHHNYLQINDFIKLARQKFHEDTTLLEAPGNHLETTRDKSVHQALEISNSTWWWDNSSFMEQLGHNTPKTFFLPVVISRPSFPYFITPYTTESNGRHLRWDEIFSDKRSRRSSITSTLLNRSLVESSSVPSLREEKSSGSTFRSSILGNDSKPDLSKTISDSNNSLRDHAGSILVSTLPTPNEGHMNWLREITMYTPVETWLQTLAHKAGVTPSYGFTTNSATQVSLLLAKPHPSVPDKHLKNEIKDQPSRIVREGPADSATTVDGDHTTVAPTKPLFVIVNVSGIPHLSSITEEQETTMVSGRKDDATVKVTPTFARHMLRRVQDPETSKPSYNSYHHSPKRKISRRRQKYSHSHSKYSENRKLNYKEENPILRRMRQTTEGSRRINLNKQNLIEKNQKSRAFFSKSVTRSTENVNLRKPFNVPILTSKFLSELHRKKDEKFNKFIELRNEFQHKNIAQKDKTSVQHRKKDSLKTADKKKEDKRQKEKEELIRKIVEGSSYSYSDDEAILTKNLDGALRYGLRT